MKLAYPAIVLPLLAAGCLAEPWSPQDCATGAERVLFKATWGVGYEPEAAAFDLATVGRDGKIIAVVGSIVGDKNGYAAPGQGRVFANSGALHNVTTAEAKATIQELNYFDPSMDFNVTYAFQSVQPSAARDAFCRHVLLDFGKLAERYPSDLADGAVLLMVSSTVHGTHYVRVEGTSPPEPVQEFMDYLNGALKEAAQAARTTYPPPPVSP